MKILVVTTAFPRWPGDGHGSFIWEAVRAVAQQGVQMSVIATHSPGAATHERIEGVEIWRPRYWWPERMEVLRKEAAGLPVIWRKYPLARLQIVPFAAIYTLATARMVRSADLIHAHWTIPAANALLARALYRRPLLVTVHGSDIDLVTANPAGAWLTRRVLRRCDRVMAVSRHLAGATAALGVPAGRINVIPDGVDSGLFAPAAPEGRAPLLVFAGSLVPRKGVTYLLQAMPPILRAFPDYRLVIVGDGSQRAELERQAQNLALGQGVTFTGALSQSDVRQWMQRARLLVLPSIEEGLGVVLLEALACGTPVVASRVGGIPDIVTPAVGRLVAPGDPGQLAEAVCALLGDPPAWAEMSGRARERVVAEYDWERIAGRHIALYRSMLA